MPPLDTDEISLQDANRIKNLKPVQPSLARKLLPLLPLIQTKLNEGVSKRAIARCLGISSFGHFLWSLNKAFELAAKNKNMEIKTDAEHTDEKKNGSSISNHNNTNHLKPVAMRGDNETDQAKTKRNLDDEYSEFFKGTLK